MTVPYEWQPKVVSTQVALIGNVVIAGVPGEFTTMSGRRLRHTIKTVMNDASNDETSVIVAGLCNTYSDYITTPEEYQVNRRSSLLFSSSRRFPLPFSFFQYLIAYLTTFIIIPDRPLRSDYNLRWGSRFIGRSEILRLYSAHANDDNNFIISIV